MKRLLGALALAALGTGASASTMRCGSNLINVGDRAFEVERLCGAPVRQDLIGYSGGPYARNELKLEEWLYGPTNGMLYILRFEGNRLTNIETRRNR
ncbi:DUF2845 domain-containing protein [Pseudomonas sp. LRF_L74]|uniref:DUF2845 domain-containing protein n=1 Tax=Pseudomonas sp. LRF_L74 TaxID=3369422 RepID=UPI003F5D94C6